MNNKGFTLIELLATITVLALVVTITYSSVISIINNSKSSSEKAFIKEVSSIIEDYIALKAINYSYSECSSDDSNCKDINNNYFDCNKMSCPVYYKANAFKLNDLVSEELIKEDEFINPGNNEKCNNDSSITLYKDSKYRYCYKTKLDCYTDSNNNPIEITNCDFISGDE